MSQWLFIVQWVSGLVHLLSLWGGGLFRVCMWLLHLSLGLWVGVGGVLGLSSTRLVWWGGWCLSCLFALRGGRLYVGFNGLCAVVGVKDV